MHKFIIKIFDFMRNCVQGLNVLNFILIMLIVLNWVESITKAHWSWLNMFRPLLDNFINFGSLLMNNSLTILDVNIELKYFAAVLLCTVILVICKICIKGLNFGQELYENGRIAIKKMEEDNLNKQLQNEQREEQKQYRCYQIYIALTPKKKDKFNLQSVNIEEQQNLMNKFLIEQLGVAPKPFEQGFIYKFSKIENIDNSLRVLFKILHSDAPVDYQICLLLDEHKELHDMGLLKKLIALNITNKLCSFSNLVYRYRFLEKQNYNTSLLGIFNTENGSIEVHEFVENNVI